MTFCHFFFFFFFLFSVKAFVFFDKPLIMSNVSVVRDLISVNIWGSLANAGYDTDVLLTPQCEVFC